MDRTEQKPKAPDSETSEPRSPAWLTRDQVAARLGKKDPKAVQKLVMRGHLHPVVKAGVYLYALTEVEALARPGRRPAPWLATPGKKRRAADGGAKRSEGEEAAHVFRLLDRGLDLRAIVVTTRVPPHRVRMLFREWERSLEDGAPADPLAHGDGAELDALAVAAKGLFASKA